MTLVLSTGIACKVKFGYHRSGDLCHQFMYTLLRVSVSDTFRRERFSRAILILCDNQKFTSSTLSSMDFRFSVFKSELMRVGHSRDHIGPQNIHQNSYVLVRIKFAFFFFRERLHPKIRIKLESGELCLGLDLDIDCVTMWVQTPVVVDKACLLPPDFMNCPSIGYPYRYQDFETNLKPSLNLSVSTSYLRPFFKYFLRASSTPATEGGLKISSQDDLRETQSSTEENI